MKYLSTEHQAMALLMANGAFEAFSKIIQLVQPILSPLLIVTQVIIGVFTAIWIYRRARGATLDNKLKQLEIEKTEKHNRHSHSHK